MIRYLTILFLFIGSVAYGADFYFSQSGDDIAGDGSIGNPYKTIAKYNTLTGNPGDRFFFNRGNRWKEWMVPKGSGTAGSKITITAYGTGPKPIITARDTVPGWSRDANWAETVPGSSNIWRMTLAPDGAYTHSRLWIDGTERAKSVSAATVSATYEWYYDYSGSLLYVYNADNPGSVCDSIETNKGRQRCLQLHEVDYYDISYLELQNGNMSLTLNKSEGVIIDSCVLSGFYGIGLYGADGDYTQDGEIKNCLFDTEARSTIGFTHNPEYTEDGIRVSGGVRRMLIHDNTFVDYGHNSIYLLEITYDDDVDERIDSIEFYNNDISSPKLSYGGRISADYINGYGNKIYRNYIHNISISNQINGEFLEMYYNIIDTIKNSTVTGKGNQGYGIIISGYNTTTKPHYIKVYNNVFAHCYRGIYINDYAGSGRHGKHGLEITNNIIYNSTDTKGSLYVATADSIYDNNFKNNIIHTVGESTPINYRSVIMAATMFNSSDTKQDTISNNNGDSPQFVTGTFELSALSTNAINQGIDVGLTSDYLQSPLIGLPDIGAYEYYYDETIVGPFVFGKNSSGNFLKTSNGNLIKVVQ